jgi:phosphatidylinositol alpha-mannosyltransferase
LRTALEQRAGELGIRGCVRFADSPEDPGPLLAASEIAVFPSPGTGVSLTLMEAMVRGRPVVAGRSDAATELIEDGVHGRLVPLADSNALADAIEALYRRPESARRMGAGAALRMREEFSWPVALRSFEEVYDEVLGLASFAPEHARSASDER